MAVLEVRALRAERAGRLVLRGADLAVRTGEAVALTGRRGAGKTTLLDCLSGHHRVLSGRVLLNSLSLHGLSPEQIHRLGLARGPDPFRPDPLHPDPPRPDSVRPDPVCTSGRHPPPPSHPAAPPHPATAAELLAAAVPGPLPSALHPLALLRARAEVRRTVTALLGLGDLDDRHWRRPTDLPPGERRRLHILAALAADPLVLLLDEPAAGLTAPERARLAALVRRITARGTGVLVVEHDLRFVAAACDRAVLLADGRLVPVGRRRTPDPVQRPDTIQQPDLIQQPERTQHPDSVPTPPPPPAAP